MADLQTVSARTILGGPDFLPITNPTTVAREVRQSTALLIARGTSGERISELASQPSLAFVRIGREADFRA